MEGKRKKGEKNKGKKEQKIRGKYGDKDGKNNRKNQAKERGIKGESG